VERRIAAAGLPVTGPEALFVTHLHSDHTLGYPDLILTSWVMGRHRPLQAYGPHGLGAMTHYILEAWHEDEDVRTNGLERESPNGYAVDVHEITPGVVYDSAGVRVTAISVLHGSWKEAYGYRIDTPDRSVVISGDTRYSTALRDAAQGVDVLVHEVYDGARLRPENRPGGDLWVAYMHAFHTSDAELGRLAAEAKPKLLVLTHGVGPGAYSDEVIATIHAAGYPGPVIAGKDLGRY
jgi:ribonuclease Z